jgi:hypothetical protein
VKGRSRVQEVHSSVSPPAPTVYYPSDSKLGAVLSTIFAESGRSGFVTERKQFRDGGFFSSEVVTYCAQPGTETTLFCKYSSDSGHQSFGHRGGGSYEAEVYERLLNPLKTTCPKFYGSFVDDRAARVWLVLEYVEGHLVNETLEPSMSLKIAARWIGDFHRVARDCVTRDRAACLRTYDGGYYASWAQRTSSFAGGLHDRFPWLVSLCNRFSETVGEWLTAPRTLIHGEYYPRNILVDDG